MLLLPSLSYYSSLDSYLMILLVTPNVAIWNRVQSNHLLDSLGGVFLALTDVYRYGQNQLVISEKFPSLSLRDSLSELFLTTSFISVVGAMSLGCSFAALG
jgi:hypothetical protein